MRLNDEYGIFIKNETVVNLIDTIEALRQENKQLKADCDRMLGEIQELTMEYNHFKERLQISPYGDDKIDELDEALENYKFQYEQLKQENEQLRAKVAIMRHQLERILPCLKAMESTEHLFRHVITDTEELLSINAVHYHNPADMKALRKAREALEYCIDTLAPMAAVSHLGGQKGKMQEVCEEALAEIDKVIGGKEDV